MIHSNYKVMPLLIIIIVIFGMIISNTASQPDATIRGDSTDTADLQDSIKDVDSIERKEVQLELMKQTPVGEGPAVDDCMGICNKVTNSINNLDNSIMLDTVKMKQLIGDGEKILFKVDSCKKTCDFTQRLRNKIDAITQKLINMRLAAENTSKLKVLQVICDSIFKCAESLWVLYDTNRALNNYMRIVGSDANCKHHSLLAEGHYKIGYIYFEGAVDNTERLAQAAMKINEALNCRPTDAKEKNYRGILELTNKSPDLKKAMDLFNKAIEVDSNYYESYYNLARALRDSSEILAKSLYCDSADTLFGSSLALYGKACEYFKKSWNTWKGDLKDTRFKKDSIAVASLRMSKLETCNMEKLKKECEESFKAGKDLYDKAKDSVEYAKAAKQLAVTCHSCSANRDAWYWLGNCALKINYKDAAIMAFDRAIRIEPSFVKAYVNAGIAYMKMDSLQQAKDVFALAVKRGSVDSLLYYNYGLVCMKTKEYKEAITQFLNAINDREFPAACHNLAAAYLHEKDSINAEKYLKEACKLLGNSCDSVRRDILIKEGILDSVKTGKK